MSIDARAEVRTLPSVPAPQVAPDAFLAAGVVVVGDVRIGPGASIWYNSVLRAEDAPITVGANSNLQDLVACHVDAGLPLTIGANVSVGHSAVLHGCTVEDDCLIGMSATVLSGAVIGAGSLVAAGSVVLEGTVVPPGSLVAGLPAKVRRTLTAQEQAAIVRNATTYLGHVARHQE